MFEQCAVSGDQTSIVTFSYCSLSIEGDRDAMASLFRKFYVIHLQCIQSVACPSLEYFDDPFSWPLISICQNGIVNNLLKFGLDFIEIIVSKLYYMSKPFQIRTR